MDGHGRCTVLRVTRRTHALIDLDGTITDSFPAITGSLKLALAELGLPIPADEALRSVVGPPFELGLPLDRRRPATGCGRSSTATASTTRPAGCSSASCTTASSRCSTTCSPPASRSSLATAKPEDTAVRIIEHFGLDRPLRRARRGDVRAGPAHEGRGHHARPARARHRPGPHVVMVGDRDHDVHGAAVHGIDSIGVLWGYGGRAELTRAGATALAATPARRRRARDRQRCADDGPRGSSVGLAWRPGWTPPSSGRQRKLRRSDLPTERTPADLFMRRLLRLPVDAPPGSAQGARKAFQTSLVVATFRCLLMYVVFPFVLPALGLAKGVGPAIGLVDQRRRDGLHRDVDAPVLPGRPPEALALHGARRDGARVPRRPGRPGPRGRPQLTHVRIAVRHRNHASLGLRSADR